MNPSFDLTTAVKPSKRFVSRLRFQLEESFGKEIGLNLKIDQGILGGAIIICKGYYFDLSLKKKLGEYFEKRKKEILQQFEI